jgi:hypothetical protein
VIKIEKRAQQTKKKFKGEGIERALRKKITAL